MKQRCRVMIPAQAPETRQSKILFKTEWASLLMNAQKKDGERGMPFHEVTGDLLELQGDMGIVTLEGGILLPVQFITFKCWKRRRKKEYEQIIF